ncbi:MAG: hypothetical protein K8F56_02070 [Rhodocyclaceae bacterium]|jgi:hypothetical protein|nr:hypothetical protein [Rhodocyclaceae bacterium]
MWKSVLLLCGALAIQAPAVAAELPGGTVMGDTVARCERSLLVGMLSPTNPNDPLFPPTQWPKCTA